LGNKILETLKDFQDKHPNSHVGGSIGLMLRGVDLKRDLSKSDLDITIDEFCFDGAELADYEERSDRSDFDYAIKRNVGAVHYVKIDIRVCPEPSFDVVNYEGVDYNVSRLVDIIYWKKKYADKGVKKHIYDLEVIITGIRTAEAFIDTDIDMSELPF
jgi:hypothetical protein